MSERIIDIIHSIMTAASNCSLYDEKHSAVIKFSGKAIEDMEEFFAKDDNVDFTVLGTALLFNETRISQKSITVNGFVKRLRRKGVEKIIFKKGIEPDELIDFISDLTSPTALPKSSAHISIGIVEVKIEDGLDASSIIDQNIKRIKEMHREAEETRKLDMMVCEDVVVSLISALKAETNLLKVLSPIKTFSDYTFVHTTNVSILALYLAESLGIKGDVLHDIGVAGLLHDIGKLFVPKEILHKEGKLEPEEFDAVKAHPLMGAMYLSQLANVPKLAIIAAFEHHMRFDGKGYPEPKRRGHYQHVVSQIISIADFFEALRADRPYRKGMEVPVIVGIMRESSGTQFNTALVDHFISTLHGAETT